MRNISNSTRAFLKRCDRQIPHGERSPYNVGGHDQFELPQEQRDLHPYHCRALYRTRDGAQ